MSGPAIGTSLASTLWGVNYIDPQLNNEVQSDVQNEAATNPGDLQISIYPLHYGDATSAQSSGTDPTTSSGAGGLNWLETNVGNFGVRIALVILGLILVFVALSSMNKNNGRG